MGNGVISISQRDIHRYHVLRMVLDGKLTLMEAARSLGVSYRHAKRLKNDAREGIDGVLHGNKGKIPWNKTDSDLRNRIVALSETKYSAFNDSHFTEMLAKREGIDVSRETARVLRRDEGIRPKQKRRAPKHHKRRPRKAQEGLMMLWDGSPHRWFGKDHPPCCAMASIDDATGKVLGLFFTRCECSCAYLELLDRVTKNYGIPASVYQDRHSALKRNDDFWSIDEELAGKQDPTQVGAALEALGIAPIIALTPQAKGRVERLFRTLQDRLVAMLELEGIKSIDQANAYIENSFLEEFNSMFAVTAENSERAWRKVPRGLDMQRILSLRYDATVGNDNAIRFGGMLIDIAPGPSKKSYAGVRTELRQMLDGSWRVYYQDKLIGAAHATELAEPIRAKNRRKGVRAAHDSRWVYMASAPAKNDENSGDNTPARTAKGSSRRAKPGGVIGATKIA